MSAKKKKNSAPPPAPAAPAAATVPAEAGAPTEHVAWIDSADPRKKMIGKIALVALWLYVAALWLLALDQMFHWGIFGPKVLPVS